MIPDAALAVLAAAYEDAARRAETPHRAAARAARELRRAGWTIAPVGTATGRQTPAREARPADYTTVSRT